MTKITKRARARKFVRQDNIRPKRLSNHGKRQLQSRTTSSTESEIHSREMYIDLEALTYYPPQDVDNSSKGPSDEPSNFKTSQYDNEGYKISRNRRYLDDIDLLVLAASHVDGDINADVTQYAVGSNVRHERHAASYPPGKTDTLHHDINEVQQT